MSESPYIPARDDAKEFQTFNRGVATLRQLENLGVHVRDKNVIDLGAGFGSLSVASGLEGAASTTAVDVNEKRLDLIKERAEEAGVQLDTIQANLLEPWNGRRDADYAFLIGVVEYAGLWSREASIEELQRRVLRTAYDALKPGGVVIFASKNRMWPRFLVADFHTRQPLVNALPRSVADTWSNRLSGEPFRHYIHSPAHWARLIRAVGFEHTEVYLPFFSYQFPLRIVKRPSFRDIGLIGSLQLSAEERAVSLRSGWKGRAAVMAITSMAGFQCGPHVIIVGTK